MSRKIKLTPKAKISIYINQNYIPKKKIEDKIEELDNEFANAEIEGLEEFKMKSAIYRQKTLLLEELLGG